MVLLVATVDNQANSAQNVRHACNATSWRLRTAGEDKLDDFVLTNQTHTYVYRVPERSGPGSMETSSKIWMCVNLVATDWLRVLLAFVNHSHVCLVKLASFSASRNSS